MNLVTVIGLDGRPLDPQAREVVAGAGLVVGGRRHLEDLGVEDGRSVNFSGDLSASREEIESAEGPVVVLASGDPGFFGIVRLLEEWFGRGNLLVIPAVSSVAAAFARAGLHWDDAVTVSAHGREPRRAVNVCRAHPKVAVLTSPDFGPGDLARELDGWRRTLFVAEKLGGPEERVSHGSVEEVSAGEWSDPNVVLVLDEERLASEKGWISLGLQSLGGWALSESEFERRGGMITKNETRALVLARLGPGPGGLIWDVGAGSGSVAIECARLGAAAIAIERDSESAAHVRRNAARHNVCVRLVEGQAPAVLQDLPEPDAIFIGGTGGDFEHIVKLCAVRARRTVVLALVGLERVVPAGKILEDCGYTVETTFLQTSRMTSVGPAHRLAPESAVFVVTGSRRS